MNAKTQVVGQIKGMSNLMRPKFGPGQLLRDDDLKQGVDYTRDLSRLLFRSLFGCGVICGLEVEAFDECKKLTIKIAGGVALNCHGDPVHVPGLQTIVIDPACTKEPLPPELWVGLRGNEKCCAPRAAACSSDDDETPSICTRERDGFEIRVFTKRPDCVCGCKDTEKALLDSECRCVNPDIDCYQAHYDGKCGCNCADCSDCDCEWILLAYLENMGKPDSPDWETDHLVRRFIRPVLIRDPRDPRIKKADYVAESSAQVAAVEPSAKPKVSAKATSGKDGKS